MAIPAIASLNPLKHVWRTAPVYKRPVILAIAWLD